MKAVKFFYQGNSDIGDYPVLEFTLAISSSDKLFLVH